MEFYRYQTKVDSVAGISFGELVMITFYMVSETPKGYWITSENKNSIKELGYTLQYNQKTFTWVSKSSRKRYAYPTKKEAIRSYIERTKRRIKYLERDLNYAKNAINQALEVFNENQSK